MTSTPSMPIRNTAHQAAPFVMTDSPYADSPNHLTFDEMREMPMHLALGFETSIDD